MLGAKLGQFCTQHLLCHFCLDSEDETWRKLKKQKPKKKLSAVLLLKLIRNHNHCIIKRIRNDRRRVQHLIEILTRILTQQVN